MIPFELIEPESLQDALSLLEAGNDAIRPIAGGTALMLMMKAGVFHPEKLISLRKIEDGYSRIVLREDGLRIGAMATLSALQNASEVQRHFPVIARTMRTLSNVRVRNVATVGGALAHGDPHMDLPPVLTALGATVTVTGPHGERHVDLPDLFVGYYETALARDDLITEVHIPFRASHRAAYLKVTTGSADDWPALGIAAVLEADAGVIARARIVVGAATAKVMRLTAAEDVLCGKSVDDNLLAAASEAAVEECDIVADVRGSVSYKRELIRTYLARAVRAALNGSGEH